MIMLTIGVLANTPAATWGAMQPATCLATGGCFCEGVRVDDPLRQPANTWSSLGFVVAGIYIAAASIPLPRPSRLIPLYRVAFGLMAVIVGVGSAYYHASLTFIGQFFDILGMFLISSFVLVYAVQRWRGWSNTRSIAVYAGFNLILTLLQIAIPDLRRYTFAVVLIIGLLMEYIYHRQRKPVIAVHWLHLGLAIFALAYGIWILDNSRVVCDPASILQGHALWHLLGAVATVCLFRYYASEPAAG